ncbi:MAG TPA: pitrilysin family protein [Candidatus Omnitrophota bacterium]|nr:pitrilysin family protein [Candidatus Omnitrophota bacterium]
MRARCSICRAAALGVTLLLAAAAAPAAAQPRDRESARPGSAPRGVPHEIATKILSNGLQIIVWPDHDISNVALYNFVHVGSRNERPGITGLSHFFEHMMFNGSAHHPPGDFDRVMEENGGSNNAYTSNDVTVYQDWFPRSAMELIFQLEADRICCLSFDSTVVESERQVVYSERRTSVEDDNSSLLDEQVMATAYVAHPYQIPVIGWPSDIEHWTLNDLKSYFHTYYAPNNETMVIAGDVTPAEVFALAERYLAPIPAQPQPARVGPAEPPQLGERRVEVRKTGQTPLIEVAYHVGTPRDPGAEALDLLHMILTTGESSRLYRRLVDQERIAVGVGSSVMEGFDPGLITFQVTVSPGRSTADVERILYEELDRLAREGPTEAELTKAKNIQLAAYWETLETINGKASALGDNQVFHGDWRKLFSSPSRYAAVKARDVQALAKRIFVETNRTVGVLVPEEARSAGDGAPARAGGAR